MKHLIILFVLFTVSIFAQIEQRPDQMEQLLWWDLSTTATANGGTIVAADGIADDDITIGVEDTVYAELYVTGSSIIRCMDFILQYGYYHNYHPNSYYSVPLSLDAITLDSTALGIDSTGSFQSISNTTTKRWMFSYKDTAEVYGINPDTSLVKLTFIASTNNTGRQILGIPLSESVSPHGYTLRYWAELFNEALRPYSTWVHNATIVVE